MTPSKCNPSLLLNFADKASATETTRDMLRRIAADLGVTETKATHIAINRLYADLFVHGTHDADLADIDASKALPKDEARKALRGLDVLFAGIDKEKTPPASAERG